ncbi:MAG: MFS transporter [Actinomycetes bacterium]
MINRRPVRDKTTWISYLQATCFGWFIFGFGGTLQFLREDLGLSRTVVSFHSLAMSVGSVTAGLATSAIIKRVGRGLMLRYASLLLATGILFFTLGKSLPFTLIGVAFTTCAGSLIIQGTASYLAYQQKQAAPAAISELHAVASSVGLLAPVMVGIGVTVGWGWRPGIQVAAAGVIIIELIRGRNTDLYGPRAVEHEVSDHHDLPGALPRIFWWSWLALVCTASVEFSMLLWAPEVLTTQGGLTKGASAAALATIVGGMSVGRLIGARLTSRFDSEFLYRGALILSFFGFLGFWLSTSAIVMLVSLTITGLGMSLHFPFGFERALRASSGRADRGGGKLSIGTGFASGVAPFALGAMSDHIGVHNAYAIVPISLVLAIAIASLRPIKLSH